MKVFVTGGSGYIGGAVVKRLVAAGHSVRALARSEASRAKVTALGAQPVDGDLTQPAGWREAAAAADVSAHLGWHDAESDKAALLALLEAARASGKARRVIYTSSCMVLGATDGADEETPPNPPPRSAPRALHERIVLAAGKAPLSTAVVRPGWVFGGRDGIFGEFFASAERDGAAEFVGDGETRWPLVHLEDCAALYQLLVEKWHEGIFHAANESTRVREIAEAASLAAGKGAVKRRSVEEARATLGGLADAMCTDQVMTAPRSRAHGWAPRRKPFVETAAQMYLEWKGQ